jgi:serine/threonine protein kinase
VDPTTLYELLTCEGKGSFGAVYKALRKSDAAIVAVKVVQVPEVDADADALHQEVTMLRECNHPNITQYTAAYLFSETLWIVMEYCGGGSIADILKHFSLGERAIALVTRAVLRGLVYLHSREQRKIHRDIKGANILLTDKGEIKLADFGVSKQLQATVAKADTFVGTPYWMAPEVLSGERYDGKADVWSVGIACIEMAEQRPPLYDVHPMRVIMCIPKNKPPTLAEPKKWSRKFHDFLAQVLSKDVAARPTASEGLGHPFLENCASAEELMASVHRKVAQEKTKGGPARQRRRAALQGAMETGSSSVGSSTAGASTVGGTNLDTKTEENERILDEWEGDEEEGGMDTIAEGEEDEDDNDEEGAGGLGGENTNEGRAPPGAGKPPNQRPRLLDASNFPSQWLEKIDGGV